MKPTAEYTAAGGGRRAGVAIPRMHCIQSRRSSLLTNVIMTGLGASEASSGGEGSVFERTPQEGCC